MNTQSWKDEALRCNVEFNGWQNVLSGQPLPMFTHLKYGTFVVTAGETLDEAIVRKQKQFTPEHLIRTIPAITKTAKELILTGISR